LASVRRTAELWCQRIARFPVRIEFWRSTARLSTCRQSHIGAAACFRGFRGFSVVGLVSQSGSLKKRMTDRALSRLRRLRFLPSQGRQFQIPDTFEVFPGMSCGFFSDSLQGPGLVPNTRKILGRWLSEETRMATEMSRHGGAPIPDRRTSLFRFSFRGPLNRCERFVTFRCLR